MGKFNNIELQKVVNKSHRLTHKIMQQLIVLVENGRKGAFIFCSTIKHCEEAMKSLPDEQSACITAKTSHEERKKILDLAKDGKIKYLVNVATLLTGIDLPLFQIAAFLRPTESLVLFVQAMGRVLRLSPETHKDNALVLDFAGNIERHRDWDNPILLDAIKQTVDKDKPLVIGCPACMEMNTEHARRCVGINENKRCDYYFEFKECICSAQNDITARFCHACKCELIDPNAKLSLSPVQNNLIQVNVLEARFGISGTQKGFRVNCAYKCQDTSGRIGSVFEHYSPVSEKALRVFYGQFVKKHCSDSSKWYNHLLNRSKVEEMLRVAGVPLSLMIVKEQNGVRIKKKIFE
jgi:DNA repair protein RadD